MIQATLMSLSIKCPKLVWSSAVKQVTLHQLGIDFAYEVPCYTGLVSGISSRNTEKPADQIIQSFVKLPL